MRRMILACLAAVAVCVSGGAVQAANLIINGDFELTTLAGSYEFGDNYSDNQVTGWETQGYNFIFAPGTADTTGSVGAYGTLNLWGPGNGAANGLTATSPTGGNFLAADGALTGLTLPITQTVTGLTVGASYELSFWWAAAQQFGYNGDTTENWTASFGSESYTTATVANANHAFTPWRQTSFTFTPTSNTQVLSFLATGTPEGQPPFSLLDGVSLQRMTVTVPEPATWAMMIIGFGFVGAAMRGRRKPVSIGSRLGIA